mgnify:CR=1 FL=1
MYANFPFYDLNFVLINITTTWNHTKAEIVDFFYENVAVLLNIWHDEKEIKQTDIIDT